MSKEIGEINTALGMMPANRWFHIYETDFLIFKCTGEEGWHIHLKLDGEKYTEIVLGENEAPTYLAGYVRGFGQGFILREVL